MKSRRMRYLLFFFAAMFLANNVVAATRACVTVLAGHDYTAMQRADMGDDEHLCPPSDDAASSSVHCAQSVKNDQQKFSADVPAIALPLPLSVPRFWFQAEPVVFARAATPPQVGPPLTILFGNFRI